ncbi:MAG TPA: ABC transporter permease [Acidimicrobiia bacterium]|jgi:peptide/nickel transport system permease protein
MPEHSPKPFAEELVADEHGAGVPLAPAQVGFSAIEAGPSHAPRGKHLGIAAWIAIAFLALVIGSAILAPVLPIPDPNNDVFPGLNRAGPSLDHLFGVDANGRDVLARVIWGGRNSMAIGVFAIVIGFIIGGIFGLISGYFRGKVGTALGSVTDVLLAFPPLVLALAITTNLDRTLFYVTLALAIVSVPVLARIARASTLSWSEREFVLASRAQGAKHGRVMIREVLPNILPAMFSIALLGIAVVIVAEAGLAILGAGVKPEVVTWGNIISAGRTDLRDAPQLVLAPSFVIFGVVLSLNYLGDVVRARFDVRESAL